jgi:hypothetical protein
MYNNYPVIYNYESLEYDRKSRSDDKSLTVEEVLERHAKILDDYANNHLGGPIPEENKFREVGSSETIDSRPEMLRLLKAIESPAIKAILVVDVQRLSRGDLEDAGRLIKLLRYTNTLVITPYKTYDLRNEFDRDAFERELKKGNEYLEYFKKIQRQGKIASIKEGNYVGSVAPFGFYREPIKDGNKIVCYTLIEKKDEADIVRLVFDWYCNERMGVTAICRRLESMNIKTKTGCSEWKPSVIFAMLENVHYIGYVRWNWRKTIKMIEDQEVKIIRPKAGMDGEVKISSTAPDVDEYMVYPGKHKGIIPLKLFERAQEVRGNNTREKTDTTLKNPFSRVMYCKCGSAIGYNTFKKNGVEYAPPKLVCNNQVHCKTGSADFAEVLEYICNSLEECIADFEVLVDNDQSTSTKLHVDLVANLERKIKELEKQELEQWKMQSDPNPDNRMPQHIFKQLNDNLLKEKEEVRDALCKARDSIPEPVDYEVKIMKFTDAVKALKDPNISAKIKNEYLKDIVERIEYERPPIVRITKKNAHLYLTGAAKGMQYFTEPYKIKIEIKS